MKDQYGRIVDYMQVSVIDRCNLRCRYCMPDGIDWLPTEEILTLEEIAAVCREAAALGIRIIKVTGGEPLVRKGTTDLIRMLKNIPEAAICPPCGRFSEQQLQPSPRRIVSGRRTLSPNARACPASVAELLPPGWITLPPREESPVP